MNDLTQTLLSNLSLGKKSQYAKVYSPQLLQAIPRSLNRDKLGLKPDNLPFNGKDWWDLYEVSYLNKKNKPEVAIGRCEIPASSINIVESKSFKLYLNSLNFTNFNCIDDVSRTIADDLSDLLQTRVKVSLYNPSISEVADSLFSVHLPQGICLDSLDISVNEFDYNPEILTDCISDAVVKEELYSNLMKSNCLVTGQPDWGSVYIKYEGNQIDREKLLKYIISYRNHNEFHEMCVERIFCDILKYCRPEKLTVYARYTRRGGIDINPFRSNFESEMPFSRLIRQ